MCLANVDRKKFEGLFVKIAKVFNFVNFPYFLTYDEDHPFIFCNKDDKVIEVLREVYTINLKTFQFFNFNPNHFHIITSRINSFYPKLPSSFQDQLLWSNILVGMLTGHRTLTAYRL